MTTFGRRGAAYVMASSPLIGGTPGDHERKRLGERVDRSIPFRSRRPSSLALLLALELLLPSAHAVHAAQSAGESLYRRYCAACHGMDGRGDGPAATALCPRPPDLTRLESTVPELMRQIDGRRTIRAHGTAAMPVWGETFEQSLIAEPHKRRTALHRVQTLAEYVHHLRHTKSEE
jgi:mono/diheme cytochrome c family protein